MLEADLSLVLLPDVGNSESSHAHEQLGKKKVFSKRRSSLAETHLSQVITGHPDEIKTV